jgi:hypothetical protein
MKNLNGIMIRVNLQEGYTEKLTTFLSNEEYECVFMVKHEGKLKDNPHYHIGMITQATIQTVRARLKQSLETQGNKLYSMKKWDKDKKFIQYCLHECDTMDEVRSAVKINKNYSGIWYSEATLEQLLQASKVIQDNIKANSPHKVMIEVYNTIDWELVRSDRDIFKFIMRAYIDRGDWLPNRYQIERYMNYIKVMRAQILDKTSGDGNAQERFLDGLYDNYFLRY